MNAAYLDRVDLSAHGFYSTPDIGGFGSEKPYNYFCYGEEGGVGGGHTHDASDFGGD